MTFSVYSTRLKPKFDSTYYPPKNRLSAYGPQRLKRIFQYKTKHYLSCCPHCLRGTVRLNWDSQLNAHALTCLMCSWTFNQNPQTT
jgi:hypothetical protein